MESRKKKENFLIKRSDVLTCLDLSDTRFGKLMKAVVRYNINATVPADLDAELATMFRFFKTTADSYNAEYQRVCDVNRKAGKASAEKKKAGAKNSTDSTNATKSTSVENSTTVENSTDSTKSTNATNPTDMIGYDVIGYDGIGCDKTFSNEKDIDISSGDASISSSNPKSDEAVAESRKSKLDEVRTADGIIDLYNRRIAETGCRLRSCVAKSQKRRGMVLARLREHGEEKVRTVIEKAVASHFLNYGTRNGEPMDIEWIFGRDNFPKVLEGKYDRDRASPPSPPPKELIKSPIPEYTDEEWNRLTLWEQDEAVHKHYGLD